jgi:hypothetical protein
MVVRPTTAAATHLCSGRGAQVVQDDGRGSSSAAPGEGSSSPVRGPWSPRTANRREGFGGTQDPPVELPHPDHWGMVIPPYWQHTPTQPDWWTPGRSSFARTWCRRMSSSRPAAAFSGSKDRRLDAPRRVVGDYGDSGQPPVWVTKFGVPIGSRTTYYNPDGSYQIRTSMGTLGNGPGTCINYPAPAPAPGNLLPINPPVPGVHHSATSPIR